MNDNNNCEKGNGGDGIPDEQSSKSNCPAARSAKPEERGQMLALVALMMMAMLGVTAMVIDVGRVFISYHELVASTDAAALAGGEALGQPGSTVAAGSSSTKGSSSYTTNAAVNTYGSITGDDNQFSSLPGVTTTVTPECLSTLKGQGIPCYGAGSWNAIQVTQTVDMPTTFAAIFGTTTVPLSATSTAAMAGAATTPYNVAIILDTTSSMTNEDSNCGATQLACALGGIQTLLGELFPCASQAATCTVSAGGVATNPVDQVALFTFPNITTATAGQDYTCPTSNPTTYPYTFPTSTLNATTGLPNMPYYVTTGTGRNAVTTTYTMTYQVTNGIGTNGYLSDYRASDTASTLNTTSQLATATGANTTRNCGGVGAPGGQGTYYAGAIYAAANSLLYQQAQYPGTQNAMILVSDGNATSCGATNQPGGCSNPTIQMSEGTTSTTVATNSGTYPSWINQCHQAITAAQAASAAGIRVYAVAYGSESSGCLTDSPTITPCTTMGDIASSPAYFYSDYKQSGNGVDTTCKGTGGAGQSLTSISDIFSAIFTTFTVARLIPNSTS